MYNYLCNADLAHPVERHLAKVEVASSSLVIRSKQKTPLGVFFVWSNRITWLEQGNVVQTSSAVDTKRKSFCE